MRFIAIAAGFQTTCALEAAGTLVCWGNSTFTASYGLTPQRVAAPEPFVSRSAGSAQYCGVATTGAGYCWGLNEPGQVGDGTTINRSTPTAVLGGLRWRTIQSGPVNNTRGHNCGITVDDRAYCWGNNASGQVGSSLGFGAFGASAIVATPVPVAGAPPLVEISAGLLTTCGVAAGSTGQLLCRGAGYRGNGTTSNSSGSFTPVLVDAGVAYRAISAGGGGTTCGITAAASQVRCWGTNTYGRVGDGTEDDRLVPVPVQGLGAVSSVSTGFFSCAVTMSGGVACWGQLQAPGDGTRAIRTTPTAVAP